MIAQSYDPAFPLAELTEHPDNPRRGDEDAIDASMEAHGFYGAVLVQTATKRIIAGNHRARIAERRGLETVPVLFLDVDDAQARRLMLVDNRTGDLGSYDNEQLGQLLAELNALEEGLYGTGYDEADLLRLLDENPGLGDPDYVPPAPPVPRSKLGDLYLLGEHRVLCGSSTMAGDVARVLDGATPGVLVTDPPFMVDFDGRNRPHTWGGVATDHDPDPHYDAYTEITDPETYRRFLELALPHLTPDAGIYHWHADLRRDVIEEAWKANGLLLHQIVYWVKNNGVMTRQHFKDRIEPCAYGWRKGKMPPLKRRPPPGTDDIWVISNLAVNDLHPTVKPVQLWTDPLTWHLKAGEWAYEPFCGSGTAVVAAEMTGRRCAAIEVVPSFVDVTCLRWQRLTGKLPVLEATGEVIDFEVAPHDDLDESGREGVADLASH